MEVFGITALAAGRGVFGLAPLPGGGGAYAGDLSQVLAWRPVLVLSLTEGDEMARQGAATLGADLVRAGIEWLHFPVADFDIPAPGAPGWAEVSGRIRDLLARGGRVLVHCRGGCGRTGMAVLRILVEAGEAPAEALARLRQVRPCAVETEAQLHWATARDSHKA